MTVERDDAGRRSVRAEADVPGTPEEVWRAIATGPGVSAWFVPTTIEEREGGAINARFGPGMDSVAHIQTWEPPHRFVATSGDAGYANLKFATEWTVEAHGGDTCTVRVVHSWFADTDDWDAQFEGTKHGWTAFFRILRLYMEHFRGQPSAVIQLMGAAAEPTGDAWATFTGALGISGATAGQRFAAGAGAPPFAGTVERVGQPEYPELLLRLDTPGPGVAHVFALPMQGRIFLPMRLFLYGDGATATAAREEPAWQAWMQTHFPAAG